MSVTDRLAALAEAVLAGRDALPADLVARAQEVEQRAGHRLRLSAEHTVVAVAGATGSGKSSLVNAVVGEPVAVVDVLRPTTSRALAVVQGEAGAGPLLDWLGVRERVVPGGAERPAGEGLILLDLPDHDSVRTEHRVEAERLVAMVDLMVWVLDPQKYADAAVHERYLRPLAGHADVMLVVLNQVDRLAPDDRTAALADLRRLLAQDGLATVPVLAVSAVDGTGVPALRAALADVARRRVAARARVEADVVDVAERIRELCTAPTSGGTRSVAGEIPHGRGASGRRTGVLVDAFAEAAGVPLVVKAVRGSTVLAARRATGWPPTRWLSRLRADPLRTLHLAPAASGSHAATAPDGVPVSRTSLPPAGPAQVAAARAALRAYTDAVTAEAPDAWVLLARAAVADATVDLAAELDRSVAGAEITVRRPLWWGVVGALQWALLVVLVGGLAWLGALALLEALRLPVPDPPLWGEVPVPTVAAFGGAALGLVVAGLARLVTRVGARRHASRAAAGLRAAVAATAEHLVVDPVAEVLGRLARCRSAAELAAAPRVGRGSR